MTKTERQGKYTRNNPAIKWPRNPEHVSERLIWQECMVRSGRLANHTGHYDEHILICAVRRLDLSASISTIMFTSPRGAFFFSKCSMYANMLAQDTVAYGIHSIR